jgi:hypothetical protein
MRRRLLPLILFSLAPAAHAGPGPASPAFRIAETGQGFDRLADAVAAIGSGDGTIDIQPGTYRQCAVQTEGRVAYRAVKPGSVILDGVSCEGKAGLVLRGRAAHVEGLIFQNFRVPDRNGAGIRQEQGSLTVMDSLFRDSEQGILIADDPNATLRIDRVTFRGLGGCPNGMCSHSIYAGNIGEVVVTRSRFEAGTGGHYLKSRATRITVTDTSFDDSHGSATNYLIDLPAGATGLIARNVFVQGRFKENHSCLIAVGAEQQLHPSNGLTIRANQATIAPGADFSTSFVVNWTPDPLIMSGNQLGPGIQPYQKR